MKLLNYDDEKFISNNISQIIIIVKEVVGLDIDESQFKVWKDDMALFISVKHVPIILEYDKYFGKYFVLTESCTESETKYNVQCESLSIYNICNNLKHFICKLNGDIYDNNHKISNNINKCIEYAKRYLNITLDKDINFKDYYEDTCVYFTFNLESFRITYDFGSKKYILGHKNTKGHTKFSADAYHNDGESKSLADIFNRASTRHNPFKRGSIGRKTKIDELFAQIKK